MSVQTAPDTAAAAQDVSWSMAEAAAAFLKAWAEAQAPDSQAGRIDTVALVEQVARVAQGATVALSAAFAAEETAARKEKSFEERSELPGIGDQLAMARRVSVGQAKTDLAAGLGLQQRLPKTHRKLIAGGITLDAAKAALQATRPLDDEACVRVDRHLAPQLEELVTTKQVRQAARHLAMRIDQKPFVEAMKGSRDARAVWIRPDPNEGLVRLTGRLPLVEGIALYASLEKKARSLRCQGDPRTLDQLKADLLLQHGRPAAAPDVDPATWRQATPANAPDPTTWNQDTPFVPPVVAGPGRFAPAGRSSSEPEGFGLPSVEIGLTMSAETLLAGDDTPALLHGYGPVPACWARELIHDHPGDVSVRRLLTDPITGVVVDGDASRRRFTRRQRQLIVFRDQTCRSPGCDAPIRHTDHVHRHVDHGPTTLANGQGLCVRHNLTKDANTNTPDLESGAGRGAGRGVAITTPTGHAYVSRPPPALGPGSRPHPYREHVQEGRARDGRKRGRSRHEDDPP